MSPTPRQKAQNLFDSLIGITKSIQNNEGGNTMSENKYFDSDNFENTDNSVEYEDMQSFEETYERSAEEPSEQTTATVSIINLI